MSQDEKPKGDGPVDQALGPAAEAFGKEIVPLGKEAGVVANRVGLLLVKGVGALVFGLEQVGAWVHEAVTERLKDVPPEKIVEPNPRIAVPALQALTYSMQEEHIRELFADLLAADMQVDKKKNVHPAFAEIIKEMTPEDARVIQVCKKSQVRYDVRLHLNKGFNTMSPAFSFTVTDVDASKIESSISNLIRLGLLETRDTYPLAYDESEGELKKEIDAMYAPIIESINTVEPGQEPKGWKARIKLAKEGIYLTPLGAMFVAICGKKSSQSKPPT